MAETPARILTLLAAYRATHYEASLPDGSTATVHVGALAPRALADWLGHMPFAAFVTAYNPRSQALPEVENAQRLEALRRRLQASACRLLDGVGHLPGETWNEPSLLVAGLALAELDALAREFDQNAVVIVAAQGATRLRLYRPEWRPMVGEAANLEWAPT